MCFLTHSASVIQVLKGNEDTFWDLVPKLGTILFKNAKTGAKFVNSHSSKFILPYKYNC